MRDSAEAMWKQPEKKAEAMQRQGQDGSYMETVRKQCRNNADKCRECAKTFRKKGNSRGAVRKKGGNSVETVGGGYAETIFKHGRNSVENMRK